MKVDDVTAALNQNEVVFMPTDTVYGLVCRAESPEAVEQIYKLKQRDLDKPPTLLIGQESDLEKLNIEPENYRGGFDKYWPGPNTLIMDCNDDKMAYLHRGKDSLAVRLPNLDWLVEVAIQTGPLATSSANLQGEKTATNVEEAKELFGDKIENYFDGGQLDAPPSKLIDIRNYEHITLRS